MHALHLLAAMDALAETDLNRAYRDESPTVRKAAIRLSEIYFSSNQFTKGREKDFKTSLSKSLLHLAKDTNHNVRYQLSWSLGKLGIPNKPKIIARLFEKSGDDPWHLTALLNAANVNHADLIQEFKKNSNYNESSNSKVFISKLKAMQAGQVVTFSDS